jgi:hypothetical protein
MSADGPVRRSFEALATRLRDDFARQLDALGSELSEAVEQEHARALDEARAHAREQAREEAAAAHEAELARLREEHERGERESAERLAESVLEAEARGRDAGRQDSRGEWETVRGEALELARAEREGAELVASTRLLDSIRALDRAASLSDVLDAVVTAAAREAPRAALLLVRGDRLTGWRLAGFGAEPAAPFDVDLPLDGGGILGEALRTGMTTTAAAEDGGAEDKTPPPFASLSSGRSMAAVPIALHEQVVAVLYADEGDGEARPRPSYPVAVELLARHAARCLEAVTAYRTAQALAGVDAGPPQAISRAAEPRRADDEESARRYARLLVSEIKLYHEGDVAAGRRDRNLVERLGGEIARARASYEQRVPSDVRRRHDFFDEELVRTLADGDAALLSKGLNAEK